MTNLDQLIVQMRENPKNVRYSDLIKLCTQYFGKPRQTGGSHTVFKTPWQGDPRINVQNANGKAKPYQVKQVLAALDKLKSL